LASVALIAVALVKLAPVESAKQYLIESVDAVY